MGLPLFQTEAQLSPEIGTCAGWAVCAHDGSTEVPADRNTSQLGA